MVRLFPLKNYRYYEKDKFNFCSFNFHYLAIGQAPNYINNQDVLKHANGNVVANESISSGSNFTISMPTERSFFIFTLIKAIITF